MLDFVYAWTAQFFFVAILTAPIVCFGWQRARWRYWEAAGFVVPFALYCVVVAYGHRPKSMSNCIEFVNLIVAVPLVAAVRVWLGPKSRPAVAAAVGQIALCVVAVGTYFLTPELAE